MILNLPLIIIAFIIIKNLGQVDIQLRPVQTVILNTQTHQ